jgi:hypothetical protein
MLLVANRAYSTPASCPGLLGWFGFDCREDDLLKKVIVLSLW